MSAPLLEIRVLPHGEGLALPRYETAGAAGLDLRAAVPANEPMILAPGARGLVPTGLSIAIPLGFEGQVRARSGLAIKSGIGVLNAPGTIDSDYRGEVMVILINHSDQVFSIARGERIAQLVIAPVVQATISVVSALSATERGTGGFGSTGV